MSKPAKIKQDLPRGSRKEKTMAKNRVVGAAQAPTVSAAGAHCRKLYAFRREDDGYVYKLQQIGAVCHWVNVTASCGGIYPPADTLIQSLEYAMSKHEDVWEFDDWPEFADWSLGGDCAHGQED
jgi:hypothetical protein